MSDNPLTYFDLNKRTEATAAECPECGKLTIVSESGNTYRCLNCDFRRDFSQGRKKKGKFDDLIPLIISTVGVLLVLLL